MARHLARIVIGMLCIVSGGACGPSQPSSRTIAYLPNRPIAERLLPGDKHVVVEMKMSTAPVPAGRSFEREIQDLRRSDMIALVRVATTRSEIADRGTWVRTSVDGAVDRLVKAPAGTPLDQSIRFSFSGGAARIGDVVVTTGKFPQFEAGGQYLVFLDSRPGAASSLVWAGIAFRVDAQGILQRVSITDGGEQSFPTNLVGRRAAEVMDALAG